MDINEIIKIIGLIIAISVIIFFYDQLLKKFISNIATKKLWFASGVFALFSLILLFAPFTFVASESELNVSTVKIIVQCFWWLSLNLLTNQLLEYLLWNKFFLNKGIVISKILRDLVSAALLIVVVAAIMHFVFLKSVFGIFTASGVMAIILGYSAQATLSDIFAGLGLNTSKQFNKGDWIKFNDGNLQRPPGMVVDINWRFVNLFTLDNNHLSIPNSVISKLQITNLSQPEPMHGVLLTIPVQDQVSPELFKKILLSAAYQSPKVERIPPPIATLSEVRSSEYIYQLTYFTKQMHEALVNDEILSIVWYQCRRKGVKIVSEEGIQLLEPPSQELLEDFLLQTDLFHSLGKDEAALLAANALVHYYGPPEMILEYGQENSSLFIIYSGKIDVYISKDILEEHWVATLGAGDYFGEMSLLTGDRCSASMTVRTEATIIEITHNNMKHLFKQKPELMEKMSEVVVIRKHLNEDISASKAPKKQVVHQTLIDRMVEKVRHFFKHK
ncbi:mechanosensitive ion channel family protein [Legionella fallonii]|uniref:Cyclic nucleotide-binding domain-containing protein n=1 Tax=Legionella fallonii LLAP-10 TaxID=1212491 RepID=A0A098G7W7_9GAMM|nr:mechanosensitive ion channel family protein [Legionella fallonii]CEG58547.1 membrane protein of unknown function [Legionella fallonii LLAP-10]